MTALTFRKATTRRHRLLSKTRETEGGCWEWTASRYPSGYGQFSIRRGHATTAHRVAHEEMLGPIPAGHQVDHLCRNRACVNPAHLEAVTQRENLLRGNTIVAAAAARTHCPKGHPYDDENTRRGSRGERNCRACNRVRSRERRQR